MVLGNVNDLDISIWPLNETLTGTPTQDKNGPKKNHNEGVFYIPQSSSSLDG